MKRRGASRRSRALAVVALGLALGTSAPASAQTPSSPPPSTEAGQDAASARKRWRPNDQRRTVRSYPGNLAYNFLGVLTSGNHPVLLAGAALTAPAFLLDDEVDDYFARHPQKKFGEIGAAMGGSLAVAGLTVGLFSAGRIAHPDRFRAATYDMSQAIIVNFVYTQAIKKAVGRERPDRSNRASFPSGHASNAFAGATVIARHYGDRLGVPAYTVAVLIATSRLASHRHHLSDVIAGAVFGYGVGRAVVRRNSRPPTPPGGPTPPSQPPHPEKKEVWLVPDAGPAGDGIGFTLAVRF